MAFNQIIGNSRVKKILKKALANARIPNSLLFSGPDGVGKHAIAIVVAKAMNCLQKTDDACEVCTSCISISRGNFPDVMLISPEKNILKIEQMRMLKETAYLKPMIGKKRIFIVEQAEKMNAAAANSVLKILEEPPLFSHIILLTNNTYIILPTIKSRCQTLDFASVSRQDIENCLIERKVDQAQAKILALLARGNLNKALGMDWEDIQEYRQKAWEFFRFLIMGDKAAGFLKKYASRSRSQIEEELGHILEILSSFGRDLLLIKEKAQVDLLMNPDFKEKMIEMVSQSDFDWIMNFLEQIEKCLDGL